MDKIKFTIIFSQLCVEWIEEGTDGEFEFDGETYTLHYSELNDGTDQYAVLRSPDGFIMSWNDNFVDFVNSGSFVFDQLSETA